MNHRTPLYIINGNLIGQRYLNEIVQPFVIPLLQRIGPGAWFQDDNARPHRARVVTDFLQQQNCVPITGMVTTVTKPVTVKLTMKCVTRERDLVYQDVQSGGLVQLVTPVLMENGVRLAIITVAIVLDLPVRKMEVVCVRLDGLPRDVQHVLMDTGVRLVVRDVDIVNGLPVIHGLEVVSVRLDGLHRAVHLVQMAFGVSRAPTDVVSVVDLHVTKQMDTVRASLDGLLRDVQVAIHY
ncbi:uncharacterized protein LOC121381288 [Gigantopelta aegis]|uniref:uncharacterized protein LOC121381288 n=1 Tax=Gigantopelta aegis TaxID=1735272 RepID=UPI001B889592|nr:uncharacterized protein LOC121381288 [Gigantopelta aegis]